MVKATVMAVCVGGFVGPVLCKLLGLCWFLFVSWCLCCCSCGRIGSGDSNQGGAIIRGAVSA